MTEAHRAAGPYRVGLAEQATREALARFIAPISLGEIDSTNTYLAEAARAGAPEGTAVLADRQTAGRGRLGRRWLDAAGAAVLCSVLFRPGRDELPVAQWHLLSWVVALAGADACTDAAGIDVQAVEVGCKWPNDLVIGERKVAGVLAEVAVPPGEPSAAVVVGIGINCNWPPGWPPAEDPDSADIARRATSLDRVAGRPVDRDAVAARLLERIAQRYGRLVLGDQPANPAAALASEYRRKSATIGREVRVQMANEELRGRALGVDDRGRLLVAVGACTRTVEAGDVVHLR